MDKTLLRSVLVALFDLSRANLLPTVTRLAVRLGVSPDRVRDALGQLERDGLASARDVRLTMVGLGLAAQLASRAEVKRAAA